MVKFDKEFEKKIEKAYEKVFHKRIDKCIDCNETLPDKNQSIICLSCFLDRIERIRGM